MNRLDDFSKLSEDQIQLHKTTNFKFTQIPFHLQSQEKVNKVAVEANVMKGLDSWVLLLMFELSKADLSLEFLPTSKNALALLASFLPGFTFSFKALSLNELPTHMLSVVPCA